MTHAMTHAMTPAMMQAMTQAMIQAMTHWTTLAMLTTAKVITKRMTMTMKRLTDVRIMINKI
jgi:hypothetical protein